MAYGCVGMRPVDMITGPGNPYVAEAKRQLFGLVGIDLPAGPTEILVIADDSADPALVATDLLGQAEHGPDSPAWLITTSEKFGREVHDGDRAAAADAADRARSPARPGGAGARWPWSTDDDAAIALSATVRAGASGSSDRAATTIISRKLRNYGSLFVGEESTVAYGDKGVGTNHTLPTGRAGALHRRALGRQVPQDRHLSALDARRRASASRRSSAACAHAEGMLAHEITADVRVERYAQRRARI